MTADMFGAFAALIFVLALLGLFAWGMRRFGLVPGQPRLGRGATKQIKIMENQALDARNRLVVVRWRGTDYLLGSGANGVTVIGTEDGDFEKMLTTSKDLPGENQPSQ